MNIKLLKTLISNIKANFKCPTCNKKISDTELKLLKFSKKTAAFKNCCKKCKKNVRFEIQILERQAKGLGPKVTTDDVLDVKNFLDNFKGDLRDLFKKNN